jgi:hypothetical protein
MPWVDVQCGLRELGMMRWGIVPWFAKKRGRIQEALGHRRQI